MAQGTESCWRQEREDPLMICYWIRISGTMLDISKRYKHREEDMSVLVDRRVSFLLVGLLSSWNSNL